MQKYYVERCYSEKKDFHYCVLKADLGYARKFLCSDSGTLAELLGLSVREMMSAPVGTTWDLFSCED